MTNRRVTAFFWVFLFFLAQNALQFIFPCRLPSLLLLTVIFYALFEGPVFGLALGAFAGFFLDLLTANAMGPWVWTLGLTGVASGYSAKKLFRDSLLTQMLLPALGEYLVSLAHLAMAPGPQPGALALLSQAWSPVVIETALFSPLFFTFLKKISWVKKTQAFFGAGRF